MVRIEDTDVTRSSQEFLLSIFQDLKWLGLNWDEGPEAGGHFGPYFQRERASIYHNFAMKLAENQKAYWCYCTQEELVKIKEEAIALKRSPSYNGRCRTLTKEKINQFAKEGRGRVLRFQVPHGETVLNDLIRGEVRFLNSQLDDFVILKSDGQALYNFACVVDDALMKITHVLRGEEHLSNTPKQLLLYDALGLPKPAFGHLSIILDENRKKLSKREGSTYLSDFRENGFLPAAILNFLVLLGWSPGNDREFFHVEELVQEFSIEGVSKSPAIFDLKKLKWMNSQYIKGLSNEALLENIFPYLMEKGIQLLKHDGVVVNLFGRSTDKQKWLLNVVGLCKDRIHTLKELSEMVTPLLGASIQISDPEAVNLLRLPHVSEAFKNILSVIKKPGFNLSCFEELVRNEISRLGIKGVELIQPLRVAFTGKRVSPGLFEMAILMGKELVIKRLKESISLIESDFNGTATNGSEPKEITGKGTSAKGAAHQ